jgi:hypothetical protein
VIAAEDRKVWTFPGKHLSASQVNEWRDCGRCYELNRVLHVPRVDTIHFAIGGGLHKAAEAIGRAVLENRELGLDAIEAIAADEFNGRTEVPTDAESGTEILLDIGKYGTLGEAKDDTIKFVGVLHERLPKLFKARGLIAVESDLSELPDDIRALAFPFPVAGRLDHLFGSEDEQGLVVTGFTDLKTSSKRGGPNENDAIQFSMYGLPAHMAGADWMIGSDTVVKTITPQFETYWANGDGYITHEQYLTVRALVLDVADRISRGDFPIGKGWNGKHNYDHGLPSFSVAVTKYEG